MKFYIDSANIEEIKEAKRKFLIEGVTTNPTLVAKTGQKYSKIIQDICTHIKGYVSAEVVATRAEEMVREGEELSNIAPNVVVKIPMTQEGLMAVGELRKKNIKTNVTLVFSALQALMAARAGATLLSPFVGRLDDIGLSGMEGIEQIKRVYENYQFETQILVASVRHPLHVLEAALIGADIVTLPFKVFPLLVDHPLTQKGLNQFLEDAKKIPSS